MTKNVKRFSVFGSPVDMGALAQIETCMDDQRAVAGALMADHHLGYSMPIGGVVAYENAVSPSGVGFDIACGNKAVLTNLVASDVIADTEALLRQVQREVAFGVGRKNDAPIDHDLFDDDAWVELERLLPGIKTLAAAQLGTVGSGNHYVDLLVDEQGRVWIANHFGSRGFGHKTAGAFLNLAVGKEPLARVAEREAPTVFGLDTELGSLYLAAMKLAGRYAYAGRDYVVEQVARILGAEITWEIHNHHNYAWEEDGLIVVRKGATPLTDAQAFIGGSMGDLSVIVRGTGTDIGAVASAPHGAGRAMSRTKAAGKFKKVPVERTNPDGTKYTKKIRVRDKTTAAINWDVERERLLSEGVTVLGAGADEAPGAYKNLADVLSHHPNIEVVHRLMPFGVVMAGDDTFDPYKD